jgi:hypothetical protein
VRTEQIRIARVAWSGGKESWIARILELEPDLRFPNALRYFVVSKLSNKFTKNGITARKARKWIYIRFLFKLGVH